MGTSEELEGIVGEAAPGSYLRFYMKRFGPQERGDSNDSVSYFAVVRVP